MCCNSCPCAGCISICRSAHPCGAVLRCVDVSSHQKHTGHSSPMSASQLWSPSCYCVPFHQHVCPCAPICVHAAVGVSICQRARPCGTVCLSSRPCASVRAHASFSGTCSMHCSNQNNNETSRLCKSERPVLWPRIRDRVADWLWSRLRSYCRVTTLQTLWNSLTFPWQRVALMSMLSNTHNMPLVLVLMQIIRLSNSSWLQRLQSLCIYVPVHCFSRVTVKINWFV